MEKISIFDMIDYVLFQGILSKNNKLPQQKVVNITQPPEGKGLLIRGTYHPKLIFNVSLKSAATKILEPR